MEYYSMPHNEAKEEIKKHIQREGQTFTDISTGKTYRVKAVLLLPSSTPELNKITKLISLSGRGVDTKSEMGLLHRNYNKDEYTIVLYSGIVASPTVVDHFAPLSQFVNESGDLILGFHIQWHNPS